MPGPEKILVALSGGVDSSVAALLLKEQGHDLVGAYMKNWINEDNVLGDCPWMQDIADARAVADRLGIEFRVVNLMQDYRRLVVDYLLDGYQRGLTPNPDVMCNREMKFGVFLQYAQAEGFAAVATGHYAQRLEIGSRANGGVSRLGESLLHLSAGRDGQPARPSEPSEGPAGRASLPGQHGPESATPATGATRDSVATAATAATPAFGLFEGHDRNKDQSYFLALLSQAQLRAARFPVGHLEKPELRRIAAAAGLPTAQKKDSQGICFIGEVKMADFLKAYVPEHPGPIVRVTDGRVLGEHRGLHYFTLGQRRGIGIPSNTDHKAYVVVGKRSADHALLVAFDEPAAPGLWTSECRVHSLSYLNEPITQPTRLECRVRYRDPRVAIDFLPEVVRDGLTALAGTTALPAGATIKFDRPQRALASGQILALYRGEQLLGGGVFA